MARETLEAVKQMEINAVEIESQALKEHDDIILKAKEEAKKIVSIKEKEAFKKADEEMDKAKNLCNEMFQNSIKAGNEERDKLYKKAKNNEKAAIELILTQII